MAVDSEGEQCLQASEASPYKLQRPHTLQFGTSNRAVLRSFFLWGRGGPFAHSRQSQQAKSVRFEDNEQGPHAVMLSTVKVHTPHSRTVHADVLPVPVSAPLMCPYRMGGRGHDTWANCARQPSQGQHQIQINLHCNNPILSQQQEPRNHRSLSPPNLSRRNLHPRLWFPPAVSKDSKASGSPHLFLF